MIVRQRLGQFGRRAVAPWITAMQRYPSVARAPHTGADVLNGRRVTKSPNDGMPRRHGRRAASNRDGSERATSVLRQDGRVRSARVRSSRSPRAETIHVGARSESRRRRETRAGTEQLAIDRLTLRRYSAREYPRDSRVLSVERQPGRRRPFAAAAITDLSVTTHALPLQVPQSLVPG